MSKRSVQIMLAGSALIVLSLGALFCLRFLIGPDDEKVKREFAETNPGVEVIYASVGEGDFDNAWYHVGYRKIGEGDVRERVVLYQRDGTKWHTKYDLRTP
jgi:hypothetical protein